MKKHGKIHGNKGRKLDRTIADLHLQRYIFWFVQKNLAFTKATKEQELKAYRYAVSVDHLFKKRYKRVMKQS